MHISVHFPGELANNDEKERIHTDRPYSGTFFNSYHIETNEPDVVNGENDFSKVLIEAMKKLVAIEPRVAQGHYFSINFIA